MWRVHVSKFGNFSNSVRMLLTTVSTEKPVRFPQFSSKCRNSTNSSTDLVHEDCTSVTLMVTIYCFIIFDHFKDWIDIWNEIDRLIINRSPSLRNPNHNGNLFILPEFTCLFYEIDSFGYKQAVVVCVNEEPVQWPIRHARGCTWCPRFGVN